MLKSNRGILLVNLGTPDSPSVKDVRKFLGEFLMDPLVVDLPFVVRWLLVNCIIVPFRGPKSATEYQMLWTTEGSPLKVHSESLEKKLKEKLNGDYEIAIAMRYQNPDIGSALQQLRTAGCDEILIFPLFPQYAEATNLSIFNKVAAEIARMQWSVKTKQITSFATDEHFISALVHRAKGLYSDRVDHTVFSYHGLPQRQLRKLNKSCFKENCCAELNDNNHNCYRAQCYATSRALAEKLQLSSEQYSVCFQSRQGNQPWIQPYVDDVITSLGKKGCRQLIVFSPAFVADCLETTIEIGHTYKNLFVETGGENLTLVPGLNDSDIWVDALQQMIDRKMQDQ